MANATKPKKPKNRHIVTRARSQTSVHKLDTINDYVLLENIRDILSDVKRNTDEHKSTTDDNHDIQHYVYYKLGAGKDKRIQRRILYIMTEIEKQDDKKNKRTKNFHLWNNEQNSKLNQDFLIDDLTPTNYIDKQKTLTNCQEYRKIQKHYEDKMGKLLKYKTKEVLVNQCLKEECPGIHANPNVIFIKCECVQRIDNILWLYNTLMGSIMLWKKVPIGPIITYKGIYEHQQIYNDFLHIKMFHIDADENKNIQQHQQSKIKYQNIAKTLCNYFEFHYKCQDIEKCDAFKRHYRDRGDDDAEKDMFYLIQNNDNSKSTSIINDKEMVLQEECDKLHSFFLHSTIKYEKDETEQNKTEVNEQIDKITGNALGRSFSDQEKKENEQKSSVPHIKPKKTYVGKREDEKWLQRINNAKNEDDGYRLLVQHMGVFRWQSAHGFRTGQNRGLAHLRPRFKNIKQEALQNSYRRASKDNWNQTLRKSKIFYQSFARQRIKTLYPGTFKDDVSALCITWNKGEEITLQEVVSLKLYTDFDKLQYELKKCFRWETINAVLHKLEDDQSTTHKEKEIIEELKTENEKHDKAQRADLENRLSEFFHWRIGLLVVLNKYGKKINENSMVLYHGVNAKMILNPAETMAFYGPLSTTSSYHVAKTFATAKGMVLKITSQYPRLDHCRAFDASVISDYPEEQEYLIGFVYMRVLEIRTRPIVNDPKNKLLWDNAPVASRIRVVFFSIHLFREQMFSMSEHLEYYLEQFLKCIRKDCCKTYTKHAATKEIKESFLSFLCCEVAHHQNALTTHEDWKEKKLTETRVMKILWLKFNLFRHTPNLKQIVKIDQISNGLKEFFLYKGNNKDIHKNDIYTVSFIRLLQVFPNIKEVHYINDYRFDDDMLKQLLRILAEVQEISPITTSPIGIKFSVSQDTPPPVHQNLTFGYMEPQTKNTLTTLTHFSLKKIVFLYYNYSDAIDPNNGQKLGYPDNGDKFFHPKDLDNDLIYKLERYGWGILFDKNGNTGCKIRIYENNNKRKKDNYTIWLTKRRSNSILSVHK